MSDATDRLEKLAEQNGLRLVAGTNDSGDSVIWVESRASGLGYVNNRREAEVFVSGWAAHMKHASLVEEREFEDRLVDLHAEIDLACTVVGIEAGSYEERVEELMDRALAVKYASELEELHEHIDACCSAAGVTDGSYEERVAELATMAKALQSKYDTVVDAMMAIARDVGKRR